MDLITDLFGSTLYYCDLRLDHIGLIISLIIVRLQRYRDGACENENGTVSVGRQQR
jgi:hypothetical protein